MNLLVSEITCEYFDRLSKRESTYLLNGVVFDGESNNVIAFEKLNVKTNVISYWKITTI